MSKHASLEFADLRQIYDQSVPGHFATDDYVFFWAGPFSNWHPSSFLMKDCYVEDVTAYASYEVNCSEQSMMYEKAKFFNDDESAAKILNAKEPGAQKRLGRGVKNYVEQDWVTIRIDLVTEILLRKFAQNDDLLKILLDTGDRIIVEASPYDKVWGIGMGVDKYPAIIDQKNWKGENLLGICLMNAREELRNPDTLAAYKDEHQKFLDYKNDH